LSITIRQLTEAEIENNKDKQYLNVHKGIRACTIGLYAPIHVFFQKHVISIRIASVSESIFYVVS
jgi:hypothetical protein